MLFIFDKFPITEEELEKTRSGDTILLTDKAVYAVKRNDVNNDSRLQINFTHLNLCVRRSDLVLKNIAETELYSGVAVLDDVEIAAIQNQEAAVRSWN